MSQWKSKFEEIIPNDNDWDIFEACEISCREQKQFSPSNYTVKSLTYGEINFESVEEILRIVLSDVNLPRSCL